MASPSPDGIGDADKSTLRDMAQKNLAPELCELFLRHLDEFHATSVADLADPVNVFPKLWRLSDHKCDEEVKKGVGEAVLKNKTPVNVFFDCLDSPEKFEKFLYGKDKDTELMFKLSCKHAFQSFEALTMAHGRKEMTETFKDPVLDKLLLFTDRAARDNKAENHDRFSRFVLEELLSIGSSIRRVICAGCAEELTIYQALGTNQGIKAFMRATKADMEQLGIDCHNEACPIYTEGIAKKPGSVDPHRCPDYNEKTCRLLRYLSWLSHGRKESECCPVTKFWDSGDPPSALDNQPVPNSSYLRLGLIHEERRRRGDHTPPELRSPPDPDLSRLPLGLVDQELQKSDPNVKSIYRRAGLFSIALKQFILTSVGTTKPIHAVKVEDGIVKATLGRLSTKYSLDECMYAGIDPNLDISLPEVQGALHAFCCYEMVSSAKALLEYFFLDSDAEIEFMHFVPKNVHTPVVKIRKGWPESNMIPVHTVAVLTTKSGLKFVVDPTAAQYGWREIFAPLDIYSRCRVDHMLNTVEFVPLDPNRTPTEETPMPQDKDARNRWGRRCVAEYALKQVKGRVPDGDLGGVIDLPQDEFDKFCRILDYHLTVDMGLYSKRIRF